MDIEQMRPSADDRDPPDYAADIVDTLREPLVVLNEQLRVKAASAAFYRVFDVATEQIFGYTRGEAIGQDLHQLLKTEFEQPYHQLIEELREKSRLTGEVIQYTKCGRRVILLCRWSLDHDAHGKPASILTTCTDITERRSAEIDLIEAKRKHNLAMEVSGTGAWSLNTENHGFEDATSGSVGPFFDRIHPDDRSLAIAKARREEVIGQHFGDAPWWNYDPAVAQQMRNAMERAFAGEVVRYDVSLFAHGDEGVMIDFNIAPVKNELGEVIYLIPSGVDIRERHAAELAFRESERLIRESEEKFRVMADGLPSMIWVRDADGNLLFINQAYRDFYHLAAGEILGDRWQDLVHPEDHDRYTAEFVKATETRTLFHAEARVRSDAGEWRWIESWGQPWLSDEGEFLGYVGNSVDVTTRKLNEAQLEQALTDLETARQQAQAANASKSEFLANTSHEIRTPMTAILGYADLIRDFIIDPTALQHVQTIRCNGDYLLEIINDILDLSKIEAGKLDMDHEPFEPARVIEDVRSIMEVRATENGLDLEVEYDGKLPKIIESDAKPIDAKRLVELVAELTRSEPVQ